SEGGQALPIVSGEVLVHGIKFSVILLARFFQVSQRGLQDFASCGLLFDIGAGWIGDAENPDQPGKRQSLQHQGYENYAKGQKDNQIAMRERAAVRQSLRQRDGGRECDYSA